MRLLHALFLLGCAGCSLLIDRRAPSVCEAQESSCDGSVLQTCVQGVEIFVECGQRACDAANALCALCGDGLLSPGELCDDGNQIDEDNCPNDCRPSQCNDGLADPGELCYTFRALPLKREPGQIIPGDFDGDGALDLAVGTFGLEIELFFQRDGGFFSASALSLPGGDSRLLAAADFTGDGTLDLITQSGVTNDVLLFVREVGQPFSTNPIQISAASFSNGLLAADIDGDSQNDIVLFNDTGVTALLNEDGSFTNSAKSLTNTTGLTSVAAGDIDLDGDVDLVAVGVINGIGILHKISVLRNDGGELNLIHEPTFINGVELQTGGFQDAELVDMDGDLSLDLVLSTADFSSGAGSLVIFSNPGDGLFSNFTLTPFDGTSSKMEIGDLNNDGDIDVVANSNTPEIRILDNDGEGGLTLREVPLLSSENVDFLALGDFDQDADLDLALTSNAGGLPSGEFSGAVLFQDKGSLSSHQRSIYQSSQLGELGVGQIDAAGALDVVVEEDTTLSILLQAEGSFELRQHTFSSSIGSLEVADLTGDGQDEILVIIKTTGGVTLLQNDLSTETLIPTGSEPTELEVGDLDQDALLDLVFLDVDGGLRLLRQQPGGTFLEEPALPVVEGSQLIRLGDFNNDGRSDILVASPNEITALLQQSNDSFAAVPIPTSSATIAYQLTDLERDGANELIVLDEASRILRYSFEALAKPTQLFLPGGSINGFALFDLDGDSDMDLVSSLSGERVLRISVQSNETIELFESPQNLSTIFTPVSFLVRDLNQDGAPDLISVDELLDIDGAVIQASLGVLFALP